MGPVGAWLAAASFWAVGYAGYLVPLLLALYGVSAFVRPRIASGWPALVGLGLLVLSLTGILARASDTLAPFRVHRGGEIGWAVSEALRMSVGTVGTWIILLALIPMGVLFVTQISYGVLSRALAVRLARLRLEARSSTPAEAVVAAAANGEPEAMAEPLPPPLVVKEPPKPKSSLMEKGLAWQETFDFGGEGARAFQLPPVGLLAPPPASELKRTREELEQNATTLRKKLQDFGVDGHIVQVSPGPCDHLLRVRAGGRCQGEPGGRT